LGGVFKRQTPPNDSSKTFVMRFLFSKRRVTGSNKVIVFSQWTSMLDLVEIPLSCYGIKYVRLDGTMSIIARDKVIHDFSESSEIMVIIMSLKAAAVGLNLVAANHVILLDLWWNPTQEEQAIDRAHRIGQIREVTIYCGWHYRRKNLKASES
jgi:SNF2 family DNA or RNA helicase